MLAAAVAAVNRTGLTVSLEHLGFEGLIQEAEVSRSSVYRRWPQKDLFFSDLVRELARAATPAEALATGQVLRLVRDLAVEWRAALSTPGGRTAFAVEALRVSLDADVASMASSPAWRTYLALQATYQSLADPALRAEVQGLLAAADDAFVGRVADSYEQLATLLGYRLRPELGMDFGALGAMAVSTVRGFLLAAAVRPHAMAEPVLSAPFGSPAAAWSPPALAVATLLLGCLEADPGVHWDAQRMSTTSHDLEALG
jgi:AcrR family transcriptional regulator